MYNYGPWCYNQQPTTSHHRSLFDYNYFNPSNVVPRNASYVQSSSGVFTMNLPPPPPPSLESSQQVSTCGLSNASYANPGPGQTQEFLPQNPSGCISSCQSTSANSFTIYGGCEMDIANSNSSNSSLETIDEWARMDADYDELRKNISDKLTDDQKCAIREFNAYLDQYKQFEGIDCEIVTPEVAANQDSYHFPGKSSLGDFSIHQNQSQESHSHVSGESMVTVVHTSRKLIRKPKTTAVDQTSPSKVQSSDKAYVDGEAGTNDSQRQHQQEPGPFTATSEVLPLPISSDIGPSRIAGTERHVIAPAHKLKWVKPKPGATQDTGTQRSSTLPNNSAFHRSQSSPNVPSSSMSLRIINGHRITGDSRECFANLDGKCTAGIFCRFEHKGSRSHAVKVCSRLLRGICRPDNRACPGHHEKLLPHQVPVCAFYLRNDCTSWGTCTLLHVKSSPGMIPCEQFNRGVCMKGAECEYPHRYIYRVIKEHGEYFEERPSTKSPHPDLPAVSTESPEVEDSSIFRWIED